MRRLNLMLTMILLACATAYSQSWVVYNGDVVPTSADPVWSESNTQGTYTYSVVDDPDVSGNKLLDLDVSMADSRVMFKSGSDGFDGASSTGVTAVFRIKHTGATQSVNEIDLHFAGLRDQLRVHADNSVSLQRSGGSVDLTGTLDVTKWNTIRMTMDTLADVAGAAEVNIYLNDSDTPVLTDTTTTSTGSAYVRWGDGQGGTTYSCLTDYFIYTTEGAFAPSALDIPSELKVTAAPAVERNVILVTKDENAIDTVVVKAIDAHPGFKVTPYYPAGGAGVITEADLPALDAADVVIIGRNIGSGDVGSAMATWDMVKAPVLSMNLWGMRNNRAMWINSNSALNEVSNPDTVLQATVVTDDPVLGGASGTFGFWEGFFSAFGDDGSVEDDGGNGTVILKADNGTVLFARWDAGVEFYPGAGHSPSAPRTFIGNGNDNTENNYFGFTEAGKTIFFNELERLAAWERPKNIILVTKDENAIDTVVVQAINAHPGFNVTPYYPAGGAGVITEADLEALDAADVVIIGRNIGSGDVGSAMAAWDMVKAPVLSMNLWGMRNNRAMWINSNSALNEVSNPDTVLQATVVTDDPVLGGASGTFGFWEGFFSAFGDDGNVEDDGGNGTVILKADNGTVLFARWEPGVEFYEGAGHSAKGHRTFIGNGNDNTENNYFGFTEAGKTIFFNELNRMADLERPVINDNVYDVVFVTKDENAIDTVVMQAIDAHPNFNLIPYYPAGGAGVITDADQDALNEADVVVMGRNIGSGDVGSAMAAWDKVYAPVVSMNLWGLRSNRAMWVNSDQCTNVVSNPDTVLQATVVTAVPELGDATGTFDYWDGFFSVFAADADVTDDVGNGQAILETSIGTLLYARWEKDVEFYPGAGHQPNGARSYIGNGNDNTENNYFGFTEAGKTIFFNELMRMGEIEFELPSESNDATLSGITADGNAVAGFDPATLTYTVSVPFGGTAPTIDATTADDAATKVITQGTIGGKATIVVTAEDGTTTITYEVNIVELADQMSVLLVGTTTNAPDLLLKDSLESWSFNVELINGGDHDVSYYESGNYDMVFISESIGSSTAAAYGTAGFTIPCFLSEPYALNKTDIELGALTDAAQSASVESMIIEDVDNNDILKDQYASGQVVRIFDPAIDPTWTDAVFQYEFTLNPDVVFTKLGTPDVSGLSDPSLWVGDPSFVLIEDFPANSNGIEIVLHAFHNGASSTGTDDFWNQVKRSVYYLTGRLPELDNPGGDPSSSDLQSNLNIYPNPTKAETTVDFTLEQDGAVEIMLLNMNGQLVRTIDSKFRAAGKNTAKFNVGDLSNGMYLIQLRGAGLERTERLFINN